MGMKSGNTFFQQGRQRRVSWRGRRRGCLDAKHNMNVRHFIPGPTRAANYGRKGDRVEVCFAAIIFFIFIKEGGAAAEKNRFGEEGGKGKESEREGMRKKGKLRKIRTGEKERGKNNGEENW